METEFRLTGRHVLGALLGFFLLILTANVIFINFAIKTFPGEKEEKSYLQGLHYNDRLVAREEQSALGWKATLNEASLLGDQVRIKLAITGRNGAPLSGLEVTGMLSRPANAAYDYALTFEPKGAGQYEVLAPAGIGAWDVTGLAVNQRNEQFEFTSRLVLP